GTAKPLIARALALHDGTSTKVVVSAPILAFARQMNRYIRDTLAAHRVGLGESDLLLIATHTHNGAALAPVIDPYITHRLDDEAPRHDLSTVGRYTQWLNDRIVSLIEDVVRNITTEGRPVTLTFGIGHPQSAEDFAGNRRPENGTTHFVDGYYGGQYGSHPTDVPVLALRAADGGHLVAVLF